MLCLLYCVDCRARLRHANPPLPIQCRSRQRQPVFPAVESTDSKCSELVRTQAVAVARDCAHRDRRVHERCRSLCRGYDDFFKYVLLCKCRNADQQTYGDNTQHIADACAIVIDCLIELTHFLPPRDSASKIMRLFLMTLLPSGWPMTARRENAKGNSRFGQQSEVPFMAPSMPRIIVNAALYGAVNRCSTRVFC